MSDSFTTPWTIALQAPLSMGFSRQNYWSGLPFPPPGDLSDPGIEPGSPAMQADSLPSEPPKKQGRLNGFGSDSVFASTNTHTPLETAMFHMCSLGCVLSRKLLKG